MTSKELLEILKSHSDWLFDKSKGNRADLSYSDLRSANLLGANLLGANLISANLISANLISANLISANLISANLSSANLLGANLLGANLSGTQLASQKEILCSFEKDSKGIIVYRAQNGPFGHPDHWKFEAGLFLTETPNYNRQDEGGCGVSFATQKYVARVAREYPNNITWKCRINWEDLADVVVPYNFDGKGRCARLELLEVVR